MLNRVLLAGVFLIGVFISACSDERGVGGLGHISGSILDASTMQPLGEQAKLVLYQGPHTTYTIAATGGTYQLFNVDTSRPGVLLVEAPNFQCAEIRLGSKAESAEQSQQARCQLEAVVEPAVAGAGLELEPIRLRPLRTVRGHVSANSVPFPGVSVALAGVDGQFAVKTTNSAQTAEEILNQMTVLGSVRTDGNGNFSRDVPHFAVYVAVITPQDLTGNGKTDTDVIYDFLDADSGQGFLLEIRSSQLEAFGIDISGYAYSYNDLPAANADVWLLDRNKDFLLQATKTNSRGAWSFQNLRRKEYMIFVPGADLDGDGSPDTGAGQHLWEMAPNTMSDSRNSNILINLAQPSYGLPESQACAWGDTFVDPDEPLRFHWNTSVDRQHLDVRLYDWNGIEIPVPSESWVGNYLLSWELPALASTFNTGNRYEVRFHGLVFTDGEVEIDPVDFTDVESCFFGVR